MLQARTHTLVNMPVIGNAADDRPVWDAADEIAQDETAPMINRLVALAKMNELTGVNDPCDEAALAQYIEFTKAVA